MTNSYRNAGFVPVINCSQNQVSCVRKGLPIVVFNAFYPFLINT